MRGYSEEQRQQVRKMDVESLAKFVFRHLKENLDTDPGLRGFIRSVSNLRNDLFPEEKYISNPSDYAHLLEAITLLERRGLVVRDISFPDAHNPRNDYLVYLTSIGMKSDIEDEILLLMDQPEEYVQELEQGVSMALDPIVRQYYLESLRAYQAQLYISSVIGLGITSEKAIHWLAESIAFYSVKYRENIKRKRNGRISDLIEYLSHSVIPNVFEDEVADELKEQLAGLGGLYRKNRNEAGHPDSIRQSWSREDQLILLVEFRRYIATICKAVEECPNIN